MSDDREAESDLMQFGISEADAKAWLPEPAPENCEVWPENWDAVCIFTSCATQWDWLSGMAAVRTGLKYPSLVAVMEMRQVPVARRADIFDRVQIMEDKALRVWSAEMASEK